MLSGRFDFRPNGQLKFRAGFRRRGRTGITSKPEEFTLQDGDDRFGECEEPCISTLG